MFFFSIILFSSKASVEEAALAAEIAASLKISAKDAAKAAKVLAGDSVGLVSFDQLGLAERQQVLLAVADLSPIGGKALLRRYEELVGGVQAV